MAFASSVVLVTGCTTGGLGAEICKAFHQRGCRVYASARTFPETEPLRSLGIFTLLLDVTKRPSIEAAVTEVLGIEGKIDILVNNAGLGYGGAWLDADMDIVRSLFEVNLMGAITTSQLVGKSMAQNRRGLIVNIGSVSGWMHMPMLGAYSASKAALESFSFSLRCELQPFGVRVMHVAPGYFRSNIMANLPPLPDAQGSLYEPAIQPFQDYVTRVTTTHRCSPTTATMAAGIVKAALRRRPPRLWVRGNLGFLSLLSRMFVPPRLREPLLMHMSRLTLVTRRVREQDWDAARIGHGGRGKGPARAAAGVALVLLSTLLFLTGRRRSCTRSPPSRQPREQQQQQEEEEEEEEEEVPQQAPLTATA